jgi:hypothetical protein
LLNAVARYRSEDWLYHSETSLLSSMPKQPVNDLVKRSFQHAIPIVSGHTRQQEADTYVQGDEDTRREAKDCMYEVVFHFSTLLKITSKVRHIFLNANFFSKKKTAPGFRGQSSFTETIERFRSGFKSGLFPDLHF